MACYNGRMKICSIEGCDKPSRARGWCGMHYWRWKTHGDPLFPVRHYREKGKPVDMDHIREHIVIDEHGCWIWQRALNAYGYGVIWNGEKNMSGVHIVAWELKNGPVPEGEEVMHICERGRHGCCNPDHLETGPHKENMNAWNCTGDRHPNAVVPDCIVEDVKRRYRAGGVSQRELARELTKLGYPTGKTTVAYWCRGKNRSIQADAAAAK